MKTGNFKRFDHLADKDGWSRPPEGGQSPVDDKEYLNNIRINLGHDSPILKKVEPHDRTMVMVCGGPTAKDYLEEIRKKSGDENYDIFCSNLTHDWLIENDIIPHSFFMIDPKKIKVGDVRQPRLGVRYYIAIQCNPGVFNNLEGYDIVRIFSFSNIGGKHLDYKLVRMFMSEEDISPLFGGSMAGLRAMYLAHILGYRTIDFYGFDSCFFDYVDDPKSKLENSKSPIFYSYEKKRIEEVLEAKTDTGRIFLTTPVFASQARQYIKWKHKLPWIKFNIFGDNLTAQLDKEDNEKGKRKTDKLITDEYRELLKGFHQSCEEYGTVGYKHVNEITCLISQIAKKHKPITVLDYGCGKGTLEKVLPEMVGVELIMFDPAIEGLNGKAPEPADVVVCTDVLEHIEPECLENVLDELQRLTKKNIYISIATEKAEKCLPDGRNAHLIIKDADWWSAKLEKRFMLCELVRGNGKMTAILQKGRT